MDYFVIVGPEAHQQGRVDCPACVEQYPTRCPCQGFMHAESVGDEGPDGDVAVATRCDMCGRSQDEVAEELGYDPR
jgi:hypothetical protein